MKKYTILFLFGIFAMLESKAHVGLIYPEGGETFVPGETINIQWEILVSHNTLNWDLLFSSDGGSTWDTIQADIHVDTLSYLWIVPATPTTQGRIKIIMDNDGPDYIDVSEDFTIPSITGIRKQLSANETKVYPNPMIDYSTILFDNPGYESHTLKLYNMQGRLERLISNITTNKLIIYREDLKSGPYFFQLFRDKEFRASGILTVK